MSNFRKSQLKPIMLLVTYRYWVKHSFFNSCNYNLSRTAAASWLEIKREKFDKHLAWMINPRAISLNKILHPKTETALSRQQVTHMGSIYLGRR